MVFYANTDININFTIRNADLLEQSLSLYPANSVRPEAKNCFIMAKISGSSKKLFLLIINTWLIFFVLTKIALTHPHWEMGFSQYLNYNLLFLIFLLSVSIFIKEKLNRFIYLNFAFLSLFFLTGFFVIFTGKGYLIGDDYLVYYFWTFRKIGISIAFCVSVVFITFDYLFLEKSNWWKFLSTFMCVLPFSFMYYKKFFLDFRTIFNETSLYEILSSAIAMNFLAVFFVLVFGYVYLKRNRPITKHINLIIFASLLFIVINIGDNYFMIEEKHLPLLSQLFLTGNLILYIGIFVDKLIYMDSAFGKFYDRLINSEINLDLKIIPPKTIADKFIFLLDEKLKNPSNRFILIGLMSISLFCFLNFFPYGYTKVNVTILVILV